MSTTLTAAPTARRTRTTALIPAGAAYVTSWIAGLALAPKAPDHNADTQAVHAFYADHATQVTTSAFLVHGSAGIALAALALGLGRTLTAAGGRRRAIVGTGLAAAALSVTQFLMATAAAAGVSPTWSRAIFQGIDFTDAVKLTLLAAFAMLATRAARATNMTPRWVTATSWALAPTLLIGSGALVGITALMPILELSLLLLLTWAAGIAITVSRRTR